MLIALAEPIHLFKEIVQNPHEKPSRLKSRLLGSLGESPSFRPMHLWRIPLLFSALLMGLVATLYGVSSTILLGGVLRLEQETTRQKVDQVLDTLDRDLQDLSVTTRDYARWDDSYTFVQNADTNYITNNLQPSTYEALDLNLIAFVRRDGTLVYARTFDATTKTISNASAEVRSHLIPTTPLLQLPTVESQNIGLLRIGDEVWLVASRPITSSEGDAPIQGSLIMGQRLDGEKLSQLESLTQSNIGIQPLSGEAADGPVGLPGLQQVLKSPDDMVIQPDGTTIVGYAFRPDVYGQPAMLLQTQSPRSIYQQGLLSVRYLGWSLLVIGAVSAVVVNLLLRQSMQYLRERDRMEGELKQEAALRQSQLQYREKAQELEKALRELQTVQAHLLQSEKMSSLGQLTAGLAHELNNPINFIYGNLAYARQYSHQILALLQLYQQYYADPPRVIQEALESCDLSFILEDLPNLFDSMEHGTERIHHILRSLKTFSRMDQTGLKWVNLHECLDVVLEMLQNRLVQSHTGPMIKVLRDYGDLPLVECDPGQLNQVFFNLLSNAIEALEVEEEGGKGAHPIPQNTLSSRTSAPHIRITTCTIATASEPAWIAIHIANNGPAIPETLQRRLFDPFFTTKDVGRGTGLGLAICYQIVVHNHNGQLTCTSLPDQEVEFVIKLPIEEGRYLPY